MVAVGGLMVLVLVVCGRCEWADDVGCRGMWSLYVVQYVVLDVCGRRGWADDVGTGGVWSLWVG